MTTAKGLPRLPGNRRVVPRWGSVGDPPRIGACHDPLRLWFIEFDSNGQRVRQYRADRAEASTALRDLTRGHLMVNTIEFANDPNAKDDELSVTVKLRGEPEKVVAALATGLPREALEQLRDAFVAELEKRRQQQV